MLQSFLYNHTKQYWTWTFHENAQEHKKRGTSFGKSTLTSTEHFKTIWHHSIYVQQEKEEIVKNTGYEYLDTVHIRIETVYIEISIYIFPIILLISSLERHNLIYNLGTTFKSTACKSPWVWWEKSWGNVFLLTNHWGFWKCDELLKKVIQISNIGDNANITRFNLCDVI